MMKKDDQCFDPKKPLHLDDIMSRASAWVNGLVESVHKAKAGKIYCDCCTHEILEEDGERMVFGGPFKLPVHDNCLEAYEMDCKRRLYVYMSWWNSLKYRERELCDIIRFSADNKGYSAPLSDGMLFDSVAKHETSNPVVVAESKVDVEVEETKDETTCENQENAPERVIAFSFKQ